ncbi:hypothetical protein [Luteibacter yeojuensis]|uniref:Uncharacterized protein n=1 Tax=Luteibacter yeojuensis TaxID=345309 RepID=A0A7X5QS08_9GAMM|nr:hypothetical protein [Luteibacter yeojuensis]NID14346.1 hypothetical protein [Luteibacter yeojuensis]
MSTETQKVDVLAVLAALSFQTRQRGGWTSASTIDDARDAVAELIAKAQAMLDRIAFESAEKEYDYQYSDLSAALARVGGDA